MIKDKILKYKFITETFKLLHNWYWDLIINFWIFMPKNTGESKNNDQFSVGIVTYVDRYNKFFKPLLTNLVKIYPDTEFVIAINGYYDKEIQNKYLNEIKYFLKPFKNIKIIEFNEPQSLSKLWNLLIINSSSSKTLIMNDDIKISIKFRKNLEFSGILQEEVALINRSWSHFVISKNTVSKIGWFDQRFPGVGNEDEDYESRLVLEKKEIKSFRINGLKNIIFKTSNFSYGKNIETINSKYVKQNKIFFDSKWDLSITEKPEYHFVRILNCYVKLKQGMETPFFYTLELLTETNINIVK